MRKVALGLTLCLSGGLLWACPPSVPALCDNGACDAPDGSSSSSGATDAKDDRSVIDAPPGCDLTKSPKDSPNCVDESVGIFVSPTGNDGADGKKSSPVRNIGKGVELAAARGLPRVYVCEGSYDVAVEVRAPVSIFGGLSCAWAAANVKPKLAPAKGIGLTVSKVGSAILLEDLEIVGSADVGSPGDSAIAMLVSESNNVTIRNTNLTAKDGIAAVAGAGRSNYSGMTAKDGANGGGATGGLATSCSCTDGNSSTGGAGASGAGAGTQDGSAIPPIGAANAGFSNTTTCGDGQTGANGTAGGSGAAAGTAGTLSSLGWSSSPSATPAPNGRPGQGGGGGGAKTNVSSAGGGGACGGCGGAGGAVGGNGGSSFALLAYKSTVLVEGGVLLTGTGGRGGDGGPGEAGQGGGGPGTGPACRRSARRRSAGSPVSSSGRSSRCTA